GTHPAAFAADRVAAGAPRLGAAEDLPARLGIPRYIVLTRRTCERLDECHQAPRLFVGVLARRHVGARYAFANRLEETLVADRMPQRTAHQVRSAPARAVGTVTSRARGRPELGARRDGLRIANRGVLRIVEVLAVLSHQPPAQQADR